jgi:hypothetical protein
MSAETHTTTIISVDPEAIRIPPEQVARYAGGSRYRPDDRMGRLIDHALEHGMALAAPQRSAPWGRALEAEVGRLNLAGDPVSGLLLDAAGVALLEALAGGVMTHLTDAAQAEGLYAGNRYGPGCCGMPMMDQPLLFGQVDAARIGVRLTESGMMQPVKSLSFWVDWQTAPSEASATCKCRRCTLTDCAYRVEGTSRTAHD